MVDALQSKSGIKGSQSSPALYLPSDISGRSRREKSVSTGDPESPRGSHSHEREIKTDRDGRSRKERSTSKDKDMKDIDMREYRLEGKGSKDLRDSKPEKEKGYKESTKESRSDVSKDPKVEVKELASSPNNARTTDKEQEADSVKDSKVESLKEGKDSKHERHGSKGEGRDSKHERQDSKGESKDSKTEGKDSRGEAKELIKPPEHFKSARLPKQDLKKLPLETTKEKEREKEKDSGSNTFRSLTTRSSAQFLQPTVFFPL